MDPSAHAPLTAAELLRLERYLVGQCLPEERAAVDRWLAEHPDQHADVELHRRIAEATAALRVPPVAADDAWAHMADRIDIAAAVGRRATSGSRAALRAARPRSVIAAMVVIALGVGIAVGSRHRASVASPGREYATMAGQRLTVTLADGTQMTLGPESRARVGPWREGGPVSTGPSAAGETSSGARGVELDGEAYFAVVHNAEHPFAVRAHGAVARDVGTAFDVRAYPEDAGARIAVVEGAVAVSAAAACRTAIGTRAAHPPSPDMPGGSCAAQVQAGDVAAVENEGVTVKHDPDIAALTMWMQGGLVFENTPLPQVLRDIARTFGVEVTVADSALLRQRITATFVDQPLAVVLDEVTQAVGARYERTEHGIVIRSGMAGARRRSDDPRPAMATALARARRE
jgi:transmembrane sensor